MMMLTLQLLLAEIQSKVRECHFVHTLLMIIVRKVIYCCTVCDEVGCLLVFKTEFCQRRLK